MLDLVVLSVQLGRFKQGMDLSGQQEILKKAFSYKKPKHVAISINSPGDHLYSLI